MRKQAFFDDDSQTRRESYRVLDFSFLSQTKIHPSKTPLTPFPMLKRSYLVFAVAIIASSSTHDSRRHKKSVYFSVKRRPVMFLAGHILRKN